MFPTQSKHLMLIVLIILIPITLIGLTVFFINRHGGNETAVRAEPTSVTIFTYDLQKAPFPVYPGANYSLVPEMAATMEIDGDAVGLVASNTSTAEVMQWYLSTLPVVGYTATEAFANSVRTTNPGGITINIQIRDIPGGQVGIIASAVPLDVPPAPHPAIETRASAGQDVLPVLPPISHPAIETRADAGQDALSPASPPVIEMADEGVNGGGASPALPSTTKVLSDATTQYLVSVSGDGITYTFSQSTPELAELSVGDVMVSGVSPAAPYGFLRKVTSVSSSGGGQVVVQTETATLEDAIGTGSFDIHITLSPEQELR